MTGFFLPGNAGFQRSIPYLFLSSATSAITSRRLVNKKKLVPNDEILSHGSIDK